jgi:hypothetical protein
MTAAPVPTPEVTESEDALMGKLLIENITKEFDQFVKLVIKAVENDDTPTERALAELLGEFAATREMQDLEFRITLSKALKARAKKLKEKEEDKAKIGFTSTSIN